jgi:DNA gyrase subunit B
VVNALSSRLDAEVRRDGHVWRQSYDTSTPQAPLAKGDPTEETGTIITFWPDQTIFETVDWNFETLSRRMQEMAFLNRGLSITLRDERPDHVDGEGDGEPHVVTYHYEGGIEDFVRYLNAKKEPVHTPSATRSKACRSRSRCSGTRRIPSRSTRSRTRSAPPRAAPTRRASAPR